MSTKYPSIVVQNHRHRGPMESRKTTEFVRDMVQSIERLKRTFAENDSALSKVRGKVNMMDNENGEQYQNKRMLEVKLLSMKGGEMK